MRVIGPESMGVINTAPGVSLHRQLRRPSRCGPATSGSSPSRARSASPPSSTPTASASGFSTFVDVGSKIDVSGNDLLQYWADDERTTVVALHLQSFGNPRKFTRIVRELARAKPVVAVKSGLTRPGPEAGGAAMGASWSAGDLTDAAIDAMLAQSGVIRVDTPTQLFDAARVLSTQPVPAGRRVAIVSNARGASVLAVDACIGAGLETPEPSPATVAALAGQVPEGARLSNPFELTWEAGPDAYRAAVAAVLADDAFDAVVVLYAAPVQPRPAEVAVRRGRRPLPAPTSRSSPPSSAPSRATRSTACSPACPSSGSRARVPARSGAWPPTASGWRDRPAPCPMPDELGLDVAAVQARVAEVLADRPRRAAPSSTPRPPTCWPSPGCRPARPRWCTVPDEAVAAAQAMGYPVVLKASGVGRYHRGEVGGVALDLHDEDALRAAFGRMVTTLRSAMDPAIVQKAAPAGADVLVAGHQHPTFGGVVTVGLGGAAAAANADLPVRVLPLSDTDAVGAGRGVAGRGASWRGRRPAAGPSVAAASWRRSWCGSPRCSSTCPSWPGSSPTR